MSTIAQRDAALARAHAVKDERASIRRQLRDGSLTLAAALEHDAAKDMSVWQLMKAQPRWGETRCAQLAIALERQGISIHYGKRVRMLTVRQRLALIAAVVPREQVRERERAERARERAARRAARPAPKPKPAPEPVREFPELADAPPRCSRCKTQLQQPADLCGFCKAERAEAVAA